MKKISFKKGLLIYAAVLLVIIIGLLLGLRGILVKYEKAQDYNLVEEFVGKLQNDLVFNKIDSAEQYIDYSKLSRFEDKDTVVQNYISVFGGKKLEYALSSQSHDPASPIYIIHSGDLIAGELKLKLVSEEIKLDMLSIPTWAIEKFTPELSATGKTYAIQAPEEYKVVVNGYELTKEDISSKENSVALYMVKGLSKDPVITIANANGESVPLAFQKIL